MSKWYSYPLPWFPLLPSHLARRSCMTLKVHGLFSQVCKRKEIIFRAFQVFALIAAAAILSINVYFIIDYVTEQLGTEWYIFVGLGIPTVAYICFVIYLVISALIYFLTKTLDDLLSRRLWFNQWGHKNIRIQLQARIREWRSLAGYQGAYQRSFRDVYFQYWVMSYITTCIYVRVNILLKRNRSE